MNWDTKNDIIQTSDFPKLLKIGNFNTVTKPFCIPFGEKNLCFIFDNNNKRLIHQQIELIGFQILTRITHELVSFTIIDLSIESNTPYLQKLKTVKTLRQSKHLENEIEKLVDKAIYIDTNVLQPNQNLIEYNATSKFKEPYHFILLLNFPNNCSEQYLSLLYPLMNSTRTGFNFIIAFDNNYLSQNLDNLYSYKDLHLNIKELPKQFLTFYQRNNSNSVNLPELQRFITNFNGYSYSQYNEMELSKLVSKYNERLKVADNSGLNDFISIPIGYCGRELAYFELGAKTGIYHAMIGGTTQQGKTTLINNIIIQIAENYSPDQIRLFLFDYKKGLGFDIFENHPNVQVLMLDNNNFDAAISVLDTLGNEMDRRFNLFSAESKRTKNQIDNIARYKQSSNKPLPHLMMIIDEAHKPFMQDYDIYSKFNYYLEQIVREGGAYGIHVVLITQTFYNVKIDDNIIGQIGLKIAFKLSHYIHCSSVLGTDNDEPTRLQPFHIVYNNNFGFKDCNKIVRTLDLDRTSIHQRLEQATAKHKTEIHFEPQIFRFNPDENERKDENKEKNSKFTASDNSFDLTVGF
jgi:hypothetical protein